jgi:hypothetical protein
LLRDSKDVCCYCTVGIRSDKYARFLVRKQIDAQSPLRDKCIMNMKGSILDWTHESACPKLVKPGDRLVAKGDPADQIHCFNSRLDLGSEDYTPITFSLLEQGMEVAKWVFF